MRRALSSAFSEATRKATSTLAATTCAAAGADRALRTNALRRGSTAWMVALPPARRIAAATQSPATG
jgi:hypothetical protein